MCWCFFFFFSSRRRHTRFKCDWSSDVCSSDLQLPAAMEMPEEDLCRRLRRAGRELPGDGAAGLRSDDAVHLQLELLLELLDRGLRLGVVDVLGLARVRIDPSGPEELLQGQLDSTLPVERLLLVLLDRLWLDLLGGIRVLLDVLAFHGGDRSVEMAGRLIRCCRCGAVFHAVGLGRLVGVMEAGTAHVSNGELLRIRIEDWSGRHPERLRIDLRYPRKRQPDTARHDLRFVDEDLAVLVLRFLVVAVLRVGPDRYGLLLPVDLYLLHFALQLGVVTGQPALSRASVDADPGPWPIRPEDLETVDLASVVEMDVPAEDAMTASVRVPRDLHQVAASHF